MKGHLILIPLILATTAAIADTQTDALAQASSKRDALTTVVHDKGDLSEVVGAMLKLVQETVRMVDRIMIDALMHRSGELTMPDGTAPAVAGDQPILLALLNRLEQAFMRDDRNAAVELLLTAKFIVTKESEMVQVQSLEERLHELRIQLCDSIAVVDVARRAISPDDDWYLHHALQVAIDRIDAACTALDLIAGEAREAGQSNNRPQNNEPSTE